MSVEISSEIARLSKELMRFQEEGMIRIRYAWWGKRMHGPYVYVRSPAEVERVRIAKQIAKEIRRLKAQRMRLQNELQRKDAC
jgi:hypothetical protein